MPGPYVTSTSVPTGTGNDDLVLNGTVSTMKVTFDRPMQVSSFTPGDVLQIMGPTGSISGPQYFPAPAASVNQAIPSATSTTSPGTLNSLLTIPDYGGTFNVGKVTVQLNVSTSADSILSAYLIGPDGKTTVTLFQNVGGSGKNFTNTVLDDAALYSITQGAAPFTGPFKPTGSLAALNGENVSGQWTLRLVNNSISGTATLVNWSINVTPVITVTPVNPTGGFATQFTIGFPVQDLSGTYTVQLGPNILDAFGQMLDSSLNAGLAVLRGTEPNTPVVTNKYSAPFLPRAIPDPTVASAPVPDPTAPKASVVVMQSTIYVPTSFIVQGDSTASGISGMLVQLNMTYPNDPNLEVVLSHSSIINDPSATSVILFNHVGSGVRTANFTNTILDDQSTTPIQAGGAPFFGTYSPQQSLATAFGDGTTNAQGYWTLTVVDTTGSSTAGSLNAWSLTFQRPVPGSGIGDPTVDDVNSGFRIFTMDPTNALSHDTWTAVGPASIQGRSGRVGGIAIDPSDPTGNTVYIGGASGGIWKTTNFLTTNPLGPTYIPLTDFGVTYSINIGGIAVYPRNNDTNQSIIVASTGEGDTGTPGAGFLISKDGGATWNLYDSSVNVDANGNLLPIDSPLRDRMFVGATSFKVVVDPTQTLDGGVVIYAALSGNHGGIWRSLDTGAHWQLMRGGQATDVVLDPASNTGGSGDLQFIYAGFRGEGVFFSSNQGQQWNLMAGGVGNPLIYNTYNNTNTNPSTNPSPNGAEGRIVLAKPALTGNAVEDAIYQGWLYAAVATPAGSFFGLFVTKDFGENWTQVRLANIPSNTFLGTAFNEAVPTNDVTQPDYPILGGSGSLPAQGNYDIALTIDPTNPNIVYLGGSADGGATSFVRIDTTSIWDAHNLSLGQYAGYTTDGGRLDLAAGGATTKNDITLTSYRWLWSGGFVFADTTPYVNFIRDPSSPFYTYQSTLRVYNYASFTNNGAGVSWTPFDLGGTDYHRAVSFVDPTTGLPRLIIGDDQGVYSVLDNNGLFQVSVGETVSPNASGQFGGQSSGATHGVNAPFAGADRNGNLQITQFYYGAAQPSNVGAQLAAALFYGSAQDDGGPVSDPNLLQDGNIRWAGPGGDASGVGTNQQGNGTAYEYFWPCCGGATTDFFQYMSQGTSGDGWPTYLGRTFGLLQSSNGGTTPDPQWPYLGGANFAINPVNGNQLMISSSTGRIFATENQGVTWFQIGAPAVFGSPSGFSVALAYGAPDPSAPAGVGNLDNFMYVGTVNGRIFVSQTAGGTVGSGNAWTEISTGLDGSAIQRIITNPARGSHEAYAVTSNGVYYMADSIPSATNPTPTWVNITGTLAASIHNQSYTIFGQPYNPLTDTNPNFVYNQALNLTAIVADWRYTIPDNPTNPSGPVHPILYVSADSGVYRSLDKGQTWTLFPNTSLDGSPVNGGYLPHANVSDLALSLGNVNVQTGRPTLAGPYETFVFNGILTTGSASVTGVSSTTGLVDGQTVTGTGIPAGTTIQSVSSNSITLSLPATASGYQSLVAANTTTTADPDLLLATTYGRGSFGIRLAPLTLNVAINSNDTNGVDSQGNTIVKTATPDTRRSQLDHGLRQRHLDLH